MTHATSARRRQLVVLLVGALSGCNGTSRAVDDALADGLGDGSDDLPTCYIDFPCRPDEISCVGPNSYLEMVTDCDCESYCPPGPCSGCTCRSAGDTKLCPAGQICTQVADPVYGPVDRCTSASDAGPDAGALDLTP